MNLNIRFVRNVMANLDQFNMPEGQREQIRRGWFLVASASALVEVGMNDAQDFKAELNENADVRAFLGFMFLISQTKEELAAA